MPVCDSEHNFQVLQLQNEHYDNYPSCLGRAEWHVLEGCQSPSPLQQVDGFLEANLLSQWETQWLCFLGRKVGTRS